jgi:hypothetical protein
MAGNDYFLTTGFPKSGNTWFEAMLFGTDCFGGFSTNPSAGLPVTVEMFLQNKPLLDFIRKNEESIEDFIKKLLNPGSEIKLNLDEKDREALQQIMWKSLCAARRLKDNFYEEHVPLLDLSRLIDPLYGKGNSSADLTQPEVFGCPSKHMKVRDIFNMFPSFRIVHIIRDPRDLLISFFYHDMGHMNQNLMNIFTKKSFFGKSLKKNPDWMGPYFKIKVDRLLDYFNDDSNLKIPEDQYIQFKYEDMLCDTFNQMQRALDFLGCNFEDAKIKDLIHKYAFETITGSKSERRNSFIRKAQSGDWKNYFDKKLIGHLGRPFVDLVAGLGYERDNTWVEQLPNSAPHQFDFSRFRIKRSACAVLIKYWNESEELQKKYPKPYDVQVRNSYYDWLRSSELEEVQQWFVNAGQLIKIWSVNIDDNMYH